MNARNIALTLACALLAACSGGGGGGTTPNASTSGTLGAPTQSGNVAGPGKVGVSISFTIPAKSTQSKAKRSPQYISANTTGVSATFVSDTTFQTYTGSGACSSPTCTLQVFVPGGDTYNVTISATDGHGALSMYTQNNFSVTLGAANTIGTAGVPVVFSPVLNQVQLSAGWTAIYNGQTTPMPLTVNLLDVDGNPIPALPAPVDISGNPVTGLQVTPSGPGVTPTGAQNITSSGQVFNFSYDGTAGLPNLLQFTAIAATGNPNGIFTPLSISVLSPFDVAQTTPLPFGGGGPIGSPQISVADDLGTASIEYPSLIPQAQTITVTDNDSSPVFPILVDPANPASCVGFVSSFTANSTPYASVPIAINSYSAPFTITFSTSAATSGQCTFNISDSYVTPDSYAVTLFFDNNTLFVSSTKRSHK
jgi:hypothetical protein